MATDANSPGESAADAEALSMHARALADAVSETLPGWISRAMRTAAGDRPGRDLERIAAQVADRTRQEVLPRLRQLLESDIDDQADTPLSIVRTSASLAATALVEAGVPAPRRDDFARERLPDDLYDLGPVSFADLGPEVQERALTWGAAKAHVHLARRRERR